MKRIFLMLLSAPTLVGSALCWFTAMPSAHAIRQQVSEPDATATEPQLCVFSSHSRSNLVCERVSELQKMPKVKPVDFGKDPFESPDEFKFTEAESTAALALFGCDCPKCINTLRNLRMMAG